MVVVLGLAACSGALHLAQPEEAEELVETVARQLPSVALFEEAAPADEAPETREAQNAFLLTYLDSINTSSPAAAVAAAVEAQRNYLTQVGGPELAAQVTAARVQALASGADKFMADVKSAAKELKRSLDEAEKEGIEVFLARYSAHVPGEADEDCAYETARSFLAARIGKLAASYLVEKHKAGKGEKVKVAHSKPKASDAERDSEASFLLAYSEAKKVSPPSAAVAQAMEAQRSWLTQVGLQDEAKQGQEFLVTSLANDSVVFMSEVERRAEDLQAKLKVATEEGKKVFQASLTAQCSRPKSAATIDTAHEATRQWLAGKVGKIAADWIVETEKKEMARGMR